MATLFYAKVSSVDYAAGTASIAIPDREEQVIRAVPFLSAFYEMPKPGDTVATVFEEVNGQICKGVILGRIYDGGNRPGQSGEGIFYKEFSDGASVKYDPSAKSMSISARNMEINNLKAGNITCDSINR